MKSILALDVSGKCTGWCFGIPGQPPRSGTVEWKRDGDTEDEVFMRGLTWLNDTMRVMLPDIVAIEAPIKASGGGHTSPASQTMLIGLQAVLRAVVKARLPGRAHLISSSTARKTFCGRGTFPSGEAKDAVMAEVLRRGWLPMEELQGDRCDAICLWTHMAAQQLPELAFHQPKARKTQPEVSF
jgi:hypothetical protein